jgi:farnesyl-diphosphate farnesyltransferase
VTATPRAESAAPDGNTGPDFRRGAHDALPDDALQAELLAHVSRTFALTIPHLPVALSGVVSNAYLLCRIVDTVEDEPGLSADDKREFCRRFAAVVAGEAPAEPFSMDLGARLSAATPAAERQLIADTPRVIAITHAFDPSQKDALRVCVQVMAEGMAAFQESRSGCGLAQLGELDGYCYYVAGVVGEMLTRLFCNYSPEIARHRDALMPLAVSFGQGLQMTNILKDIWEDRQRGACWLPQDIFRAHGFDLAELAPESYCEGFRRGLEHLVTIAHSHLRNALRYTLLIPKEEPQIREFCLWAIGMALLTLRKIARNPGFSRGAEVKISRRSVKLVIVASRLAVRSDAMLKMLFSLAAAGLPLRPRKGSADTMMPPSPVAR